jgi:phosphatidylinositol glycan class B
MEKRRLLPKPYSSSYGRLFSAGKYRVSFLVDLSNVSSSLVLGISLFADKQWFGEWTFPPYNTVDFNLGQSIAIFYGQNDWHYYLSQGIPLLCTTIAPFAIMGLWSSTTRSASNSVTTANALKALSFAVLVTMSTLSFIVHKEVRFMYPVLPLLHVLAAPHVTAFFTAVVKGGIPTSSGPIGVKRKPLLVAGLLVNLVIGAYLSYFHGAAPISVLGYLRSEFERIHPQNLTLPAPFMYRNETTEPLELFALFLTPCHTTPWRSHLVYPALRARALTCEPPLHTAPGSPERAAYVDEGYRFDADKVGFLDSEMWPSNGAKEELPRYIIGFEGIEGALNEYFATTGPGGWAGTTLKQTWSGWNGLFTDDDRKAGAIRVWDTGIYPQA